MCGNCKDGKCEGKKCLPYVIAKILVIVGGLNWGLVGISTLLGISSLNLVDLVFGVGSILSAVVYLLVAISAVMMIFGCKCKTCKDGSCDTGAAANAGQMQ